MRRSLPKCPCCDHFADPRFYYRGTMMCDGCCPGPTTSEEHLAMVNEKFDALMVDAHVVAARMIANLGYAVGAAWATHWSCSGGQAAHLGRQHEPWSGRLMSEWPPEHTWASLSDIRMCPQCGCTLGRGPADIRTSLAEWQAEHARLHPGTDGPVSRWSSGDVSWQVCDVFSPWATIAVGKTTTRGPNEENSWISEGSGTSKEWNELARLRLAADGVIIKFARETRSILYPHREEAQE